MIYFIVIISLVALLSISDFYPRLRIGGKWLTIVLLSMLAGWRNMGGGDFAAYREFYYGVDPLYFTDERGYIWLNHLFHTLGFSYNAFLFFYSLISIFLLVHFLHKHTKFPSLSLLFYIACYFFFYNLVLNRQMLCMPLSLWAMYYWDRHKWYSLGAIFLGMLFHNSIFVIVPFLLIFEFLKSTKGYMSWYLFFGGFLLVSLCVSPIQSVEIMSRIPGLSFIDMRLQGYFSHVELSSYTLNSIEYLKMALGLTILLPFVRQIMKNKSTHIWVFMYFVGLIMLIWTRNIEILFRVFVYFDLSLLVLLPICVQYFVDFFTGKQKQIALISIYGTMGGLAVFSMLYRAYHFGNATFFYYYKFYFF